MNWRGGWFLDSAPAAYIVLSSGAAGKYYFEVTINHIGSDNSTFATGIANKAALLKDLFNGANLSSNPVGAIAAQGGVNGLGSGRGLPGLGSTSITPGTLVSLAVDTATQLAWIRTGAGSWFGLVGGVATAGDPVAETNGSNFGSGTFTVAPTVLAWVGVAGPGGSGDVGPGTPVAAPALSTAAGGTLPSRTYYVRTAYAVFNNIPGFSSKESTITVPANSLLVVTSPPADPNGYAGDWIVYASTTAGAGTNQSGLIVLGTNWTEPTTGLTTTGATAPYVKGTVNFGGTAFTGAVPTGYSGWSSGDSLNANDNSGLALSGGNLIFDNTGMAISGIQGPVWIVRSGGQKAL